MRSRPERKFIDAVENLWWDLSGCTRGGTVAVKKIPFFDWLWHLFACAVRKIPKSSQKDPGPRTSSQKDTEKQSQRYQSAFQCGDVIPLFTVCRDKRLQVANSLDAFGSFDARQVDGRVAGFIERGLSHRPNSLAHEVLQEASRCGGIGRHG